MVLEIYSRAIVFSLLQYFYPHCPYLAIKIFEVNSKKWITYNRGGVQIGSKYISYMNFSYNNDSSYTLTGSALQLKKFCAKYRIFASPDVDKINALP
jgi:hypothetical protein